MTSNSPALISVIRWVVLPSISSALILLALAYACRWIWGIERRLGILVSTGLAIRLMLASVLFWVSYLGLPPLASLQLGGGFWKMALDAQVYYALGLHAAEQGLFSVPLGAPSRTYVLALAVWMTVAGTSPFSAVLLNATCYVGTCAAIVAVLRGLGKSQLRRAGIPIVATISASPMLLFVSTQALKDSFFTLFAIVISIGVWWVTSLLTRPSRESWGRLAPGTLALGLGIFMTAGVRVYFPVIATACYGLALLASFAYSRRSSWRLTAATSVLTVAFAAASLTLGSDEGRSYLALAMRADSPSQFFNMVERARSGFQKSAGTTNVARPAEGGSEDRSKNLLVGLATLFVPLTFLRAVSIVNTSGSLAMVVLGDLDTLFFDVTVIAMGIVAFRLWRVSEKNVPYLVFTLSLALLLSALMAYTVTNVGTLVRLRLMVLAPCWALPFAFVQLPRNASIGPDRDGTLPR